NGRELTAILLHEVAHMVYYKNIELSMHEKYLEAMFDIKKKIVTNDEYDEETKSSDVSYVNGTIRTQTMRLWVIDYIQNLKFFKDKDSLELERMMDSFVTYLGRGKDLSNALEKIYKAYGRDLLMFNQDALANTSVYLELISLCR